MTDRRFLQRDFFFPAHHFSNKVALKQIFTSSFFLQGGLPLFHYIYLFVSCKTRSDILHILYTHVIACIRNFGEHHVDGELGKDAQANLHVKFKHMRHLELNKRMKNFSSLTTFLM